MKRKLFLFVALLTATVMNLNAETATNVKYIDADGKEQTCASATVVESGYSITWNAGWYVVNGTNVTISAGTVCNGAVNMILADGTKLTVKSDHEAGITVSGDANSLTIYGQANQSGQLIATGGDNGAGIGGGDEDSSGSNITINGGEVTATGGNGGAGIGGGYMGVGSNITINGGIVTATGSTDAAGIGSGDNCSTASSNIFVNPSLIFKADNNNPPTTEIAHASITDDVASLLAGKRYVTAGPLVPDMHDFLHFVGLNGNDTVRLNKYAMNANDLASLTATFEYSKDRINWESVTWATDTCPKNTYQGNPIALAEGDTIFFRAKGKDGKNATLNTNPMRSYFNFAFGADDQIAAGGNTMSLYDATCEQDTMTVYGFGSLFRYAKQLVTAPKVPAVKLAKGCYKNMFSRTSSLTQAPVLQATTLADECYGAMFEYCVSLTQAPALPATTLQTLCYNLMFSNCTALTQAPELKATIIAQKCYSAMFRGCSSLEVNTYSSSCDGAELVVPTVSGTAPTDWNSNMFLNCKGDAALTAQYGIQVGGHYCIKEYKDTLDYLHFVSLKDNGTVKLNKRCVSGNLAATFEYSKDRKTWIEYTWGTFSPMPSFVAEGSAIALAKGDTVFFRAKGANGKNASMSTTLGVAYFFFAFGASDSIAAGGNAMSLYDASCAQDAMTANGFCMLFKDNQNLISVSELKLPATQLAKGCYQSMFQGCTALTQIPELKATTLAELCYCNMFYDCTSLEVDTCTGSCNGAELVVPKLANEPDNWNGFMFSNCKGDAKYTAQYGIKLGGHYCIKEYVPVQIIVTYDLQGHGEAIENDTIKSGDKLTRPADPEAQGYEFRNWYTDAQSSGKAFDFSKAVTADKDTTITLYAKWRDSVAWEQFKDSLDKYSYVEYDTAYQAGFMIHLATSENAQVQPLKEAAYIEASEEVLANYDFTTWKKALLEEYTWASDELNKCLGIEEYAPIRRKPKQNYFLQLISAYTQLPYRVNGLNAVGGLFSSYVDLVYKAWLETNYEKDAELCNCMFNSDVFFEGTARMMAAFEACEK